LPSTGEKKGWNTTNNFTIITKSSIGRKKEWNTTKKGWKVWKIEAVIKDKGSGSHMWLYTPQIPAFRRMRQEDYSAI
jgi:hypothetical protein